MGTEIQKTCKICGAEYSACLSCERNHGWKIHTDTLEHYYIFLALMSYQVNHDAKRAYRVLRERGVDFRDTEGLLPYARELLAEIDALAHEGSRARKAPAKAGGPKPGKSTERKAAEPQD